MKEILMTVMGGVGAYYAIELIKSKNKPQTNTMESGLVNASFFLDDTIPLIGEGRQEGYDVFGFDWQSDYITLT